YDNNNNTRVDNNRQFRCFWPKCRYKTYIENNLFIHQLMHSSIKQFEFRIIDAFIVLIGSQTDNNVKCESDLVNHKLIHSSHKPFKCNDCNKTFKSQSSVNCHISCGKYFANLKHLRHHKRYIHLSIKPFKCDVDNCGKQIATKSGLSLHQRKYSGIKPFKSRESRVILVIHTCVVVITITIITDFH
ncbi:zinc finger protein 578-like, partial [Oppia nitens]|uniref:zinc finger protein 578-like n=1 Tax=Oppia nitens TaxID=1686743 RepID=UPI0023DC55A1